MAKKTETDTVVPFSRFRRGGAAEQVPEIGEAPLPSAADVTGKATMKPPVDLSGRPKIWCLLSSNGGGKTTYARWLNHNSIQAGAGAPSLAALDPGNRSLVSWFAEVDQPPNRDTKNTARWLRDYLDFLVSEQRPAILDFGGGGETALLDLLSSNPDLVPTIEAAGSSLVACYPLTTRITDVFVAKGFEDVGFQPAATMLLLNEGRADPTRPPEETFEEITRHSVFRNMVARGAQVIWMPALDSEVIEEVERKQLPWEMARSGQVPPGASFYPIGGLRRSAVGRWLAIMDRRHIGVASWLL